jgi:hypothetical protein
MKTYGIDMSAQLFEIDDDFDIARPPKTYNNIKITYDDSKEEKHDPILYKDDPVALTCASYRLWVNNHNDRWHLLEDCRIEPEDRDMAASIRKYYGQRLVLEALSGVELTTFRTKLGAFLEGNHVLERDELGLLYRLPYFYHEDVALDEVIAMGTSVDGQVYYRDNVITLSPRKTLFQSRKSGDVVNYWFTDKNNGNYLLPVKSNNSLGSLIESLYNKASIDVVVNLQIKNYHAPNKDKHYYQISNLRLV